MKTRCIFDLESDGLLYDATIIWCIVIKDLNSQEVFKYIPSNIEEGIDKLSSYDLISGHNICGFDIPLIEKLYPYFTYKEVRDTLCMSKLFNPERLDGHSLESYGKQFGRYKPVHEDWSQYSEEMLYRCSEDVEINHLLYKFLVDEYCQNWKWLDSLKLEQEYSYLQAQQELEGVDIDKEFAIETIGRLDEEIFSLSESLYPRIPDKIKPIGAVILPFKKDGTYKEIVNKHLSGINVRGMCQRITFERINLDSSKQIKDYLLSVGWIPTEYNINKETKARTSPKLTEDSYGSIKDDTGKLVARRNILVHRRRTIENFKDPENKGILSFIRDDGRVPAEAHVCSTPTSRSKHKGAICNIPKALPNVVYGLEMRKIFCIKEPYIMIGADLDQIEARIGGHYATLFDGGEYWNRVSTIEDLHSFNAEIFHCDRNSAKTVKYSIDFGARAPKVASYLGCSIKEAQGFIDAFWDTNYGLKDFLAEGSKYYKKHKFIVGLDGRKLYLRAEYKMLNLYIQSAAAIIFKRWSLIATTRLKEAGLFCKQILAVHDEVAYRCSKNDADIAVEIIEQAAIDAGKYYNLLTPVTTKCKVGANWAEVH